MPNPLQIAEIRANGQKFSNWKTVRVEAHFRQAARIAQFTVTEDISKTKTFRALQLKPGDDCEIYLAGQKALTGKVQSRQSAYDSGSHDTVITAIGVTQKLCRCSVPTKGSQLRGYPFEAIAKNLLQPFGINLKMLNVPSYASKPFPDINTWPGEPVFDAIDRLAKLRTMFVRSNADGDLVVGCGSTDSKASFVEGQNIVSSTCLLRDDTIYSKIDTIGQQAGNDKVSSETARKPAAFAQGQTEDYSPLTIVSEEPGDSEDMARRADFQAAWLAGLTMQCSVVVKSWLKPDGSLWDPEDCYTVTSPMHLLDKALLGAQAIIWSQDNENGTQTAIEMTRPDARYGAVDPTDAKAGGGDSIYPGKGTQPAKPLPDDGTLAT